MLPNIGDKAGQSPRTENTNEYVGTEGGSERASKKSIRVNQSTHVKDRGLKKNNFYLGTSM